MRNGELTGEWGARSAVFAVEEVAHGGAAGGGLLLAGALVAEVAGGFFGIGFAARGAAIGEAGFAGTQLEFLSAFDAGFDGEGHGDMVAPGAIGVENEGP
jgi:hypothetical protein